MPDECLDVSKQTELPSMVATLFSYENWFGPYHPVTLSLMAQVAFACWQAGELRRAYPLLERVVKGMDRQPGALARLG
jgi:hypothetical protein